MSKFISNVNVYMQKQHIKQNYIGLITGWDKSKVSRMLREDGNPREDEMAAIASALGKTIDFFLTDDIEDEMVQKSANQIAFFAGKLNKSDASVANKLIEMLRFYDAIVNI